VSVDWAVTQPQAASGTDSDKDRGTAARLLVGVPVVALLALLCLLFLSWTGWGFETDPAAQLLRDAHWLVLAGLTGAGAGAVIAWVLVGRRNLAMAVGAILGALPAVVMVTAYFTDAY
jgi:hypothetical protein